MAKKKHSLATISGYENLRRCQKYLFTPLTGLSKGSFSSVFLSNYKFSSRCHGYLHSCWSWPSAVSSLSAHMGYPLCERNQPAGGHNQPRPKKLVGTRCDYLACNFPGWARVTPGDSVLPSSQHHSGGSSNSLGNRPPKKQESC